MVNIKYGSDEEIEEMIADLLARKAYVTGRRKAKYYRTGDKSLKQQGDKEKMLSARIMRLRSVLHHRRKVRVERGYLAGEA